MTFSSMSFQMNSLFLTDVIGNMLVSLENVDNSWLGLTSILVPAYVTTLAIWAVLFCKRYQVEHFTLSSSRKQSRIGTDIFVQMGDLNSCTSQMFSCWTLVPPLAFFDRCLYGHQITHFWSTLSCVSKFKKSFVFSSFPVQMCMLKYLDHTHR